MILNKERFATLYKKDSKGRLRKWSIDVIADVITVKAGLIDGKQNTSTKKVQAKVNSIVLVRLLKRLNLLGRNNLKQVIKV